MPLSAVTEGTEKPQHQLLDHLLEGFQIIDFEYRYLYVNETVAQQGKSPKQALIGKKMSEVYPGIEDTPFFTELRKCMEHRKPHSMENEFVFPDGSRGWFELRMEPIPEGIFILSLDITDKKTLEVQTKELMELKNNFIRVISHQLRTPLGIVSWSLEELVDQELLSDQEKNDAIKTAYVANQLVISRINDMLLALDIEEGNVKLVKEPVDILKLTRSVFNQFDDQAQQKKLHYTLEIPEMELLPIIIDPARFNSALTKIIDNAITYTQEGGQIKVTVLKKNYRIRFEVTDTGIGVPSTEQGHIFERFYRGSNAFSMKADASGLGLYTACYFIEAHGGVIGFNSREGEGSCFWFEIPINTSESLTQQPKLVA